MRRARLLSALLAMPALLASACGSGGGGGSASNSSSLSPSTATPSASSTPSATLPVAPVPTLLVWAVVVGTHIQVRTLPIAGGAEHTVATLPADAQVFAAGAGKLAVGYPDHTLHVIDLGGGADTVFSPGGMQLYGGAFSPDGTRFAFVSATTTSSGRLMVADTGSHGLSTLRSFSSNHYDVPKLWRPEAMVGVELVGFSDAPLLTVVRLDPAAGTRLAASDIAGSYGPAISADGVHAAVSKHAALGDDADSPGGPGPPQPSNTLQALVVGGTPTTLFQQAHHQVVPLAVSDDGGTICYSDDPAAGGFAGATLSDSLGLFLRSGSTTTQLAHWDTSRWDHAVFVGNAVAAANHSSSAEKLLLVAAGGGPTVLDSVSGAEQATFLGTA